MEKEIFVKYSSVSAENELFKIGFDSDYLREAALKYKSLQLKIFHLKPPEANILKQLCLSLGFDCAVAKGSIDCSVERTNALIIPTEAQLKNLILKLKLQPYRLKLLAENFETVLNTKRRPIKIRQSNFDWTKPYIAGILNITPDSFSDGGEYLNIEKAVNRVEELIYEGADIIDIGGESTRPGFNEVDSETEEKRVIPVIEKIRKLFPEIVLSIDTRKPYIAQKALESGVDIVNDVEVLNEEMIFTIKKYSCPIIVCCNKKFDNNNIVENVYEYFNDTLHCLVNRGIERSNIIFDPAIGFNKTVDENFELIKSCFDFNSLHQPMLWGISRKSFIQKSFNLKPKECDFPSLLYSNYLISKGANIIRTHEVKNLKRSFEFMKKLYQG